MTGKTPHPCFDADARHKVARVHLPVAPKCNVGCNFCDRRFDCISESRPGVTSTVLTPEQALAYTERLSDLIDVPITVVGIAGPGDPFANAEETLRTLRLIRARFPDVLLCVASNGLCLAEHVDALAELKVSHVTVTVNAVDPAIGAKIYRFVRPQRIAFRGTEGASLLLERQIASIQALRRVGITTKINTIFIPTINDHHVEEVSRTVAALGAQVQNCIPLYRVEGTPFVELPEPDPSQMLSLRERAGRHLSQMAHCARCRADAAGLLGQGNSEEIQNALVEAARLPMRPEEHRPNIAVATLEGVLVNQHLGEADEFWIFTRREDGSLRFIERRPAPMPGHGELRWEELGRTLHDCRALLCAAAGQRPKLTLSAQGIRVLVAEGLIEEAAEAVWTGQKPRMPARVMTKSSGCDDDGVGCGGCTGSGTGCG